MMVRETGQTKTPYFICWLVFNQPNTSKSHMEKGLSTKDMPPYDWYVDKSVMNFPKLMIDAGVMPPLSFGPGCFKGAG